MATTNPIVNLIVQGARQRGVDPAAALAVASVEGLSGGIGDGGHAYGPFQLNNAGGVITGSHPGANSQQIQQWAQSQAGIAFALDRIASVAKGLKGAQAVNAIVSKFERPANIPGEITKATDAYGRYGGTNLPSAQPMIAQRLTANAAVAPIPNPSTSLSQNVLSVLNRGNEMFGLDPLPTVPAVPAVQSSAPTGQRTVGAAAVSSTAKAPPTSTYKPPVVKGKTLRYIEHFAAPFGLQITATTNGTHAKNSYHYQGRAVDFGAPLNAAGYQKMSALAKTALAHPDQWSELIYTGPGNPGFAILGGKVIPNSQLPKSLYDEHLNHVHVAR